MFSTYILSSGLSLIVNIDQDEYVGDLGDAAGIRVVTHPQRTIPFPEEEGISVGPGLLTNVGIRMVCTKEGILLKKSKICYQ